LRNPFLVAIAGVASLAHAAHADPRPIHGSVGIGGTFVAVGEDGDHFRNDLAFTLKWRSRFGGIVAWRSFDAGSLGDGDHAGLLTAGLVYEGGAARPRLVLDLVVEAGADLDQKAPLFGGAILTTLTIVGPLGVALHTGAYLVIDGVDDSRLHLLSSALLVARW
jgi:hypothetical protein